MNWKRTIVALGLGVATGYFVKSKLNELPVQPERALKLAKEKFKENGAVSGSWIFMKSEKLALHGLNYLVYRGGITRTIDGENQQYEFYVDVFTGSIISTRETEAIV